jgi:hypothetical protein
MIAVMRRSAKRWTCDRCTVSFGQIDGDLCPMPKAWTESEDGTFCLACRRANAVDAALEAEAEGRSREDRVRIRRTALIEFELRRLPATPDNSIARACRTSTVTVTKVRRDMEVRATGGPVA